MSITRADFFGELGDVVRKASGVKRLGQEAHTRLGNIGAHLERQQQDPQPLQHESIVPDAEAVAMRNHFKLLLLAQMRGSKLKKTPQIPGTKLHDLRGEQSLSASIINDKDTADYMAELRTAIDFNRDSLPANTVDHRVTTLPNTNVHLYTYLTGVREPGFRPVDPRVAIHIENLADELGLDYVVSSALNQSSTPYVFPDGLNNYTSRAPYPNGIQAFGNKCFRSPQKADASIITNWPRVGHFAAIAGAGFGQLVEVDDNGEFKRHANIFLGPNNVLGADRSVLACTLQSAEFNLQNTFLLVEHQEGGVYAVDLPTDDQIQSGAIPANLVRNHQWVRTAQKRYGERAAWGMAGGCGLSPHLPRQGKPVFNLTEMIELEAQHCRIPHENVLVRTTCPTMGAQGSTDNILRHWSNTVETSLFPGQFVAPGTAIPPDNLLLWPRNGYITWVQ